MVIGQIFSFKNAELRQLKIVVALVTLAFLDLIYFD